MSAITYLFVPAHDARKVERAMTAGGDAVILDLEDSVPASEKVFARAALAQMTKPAQVERWVRVNADPDEFEADLASIDWAAVTGALLPKAEDSGRILSLEAAGARRIILLIETAAGIRALPHLATTGARVERCALGTWDLAVDLGLLPDGDVDDSELLWHVRADLVVVSRALGLQPPLDGIFACLDDEPGLARACRRVAQMGFGGKLLIHPRQIAVATRAFKPDRDRLERAREIVDAYEEALRHGRGAIQVRGRMVDRPVAECAKALLERWSVADELEKAP